LRQLNGLPLRPTAYCERSLQVLYCKKKTNAKAQVHMVKKLENLDETLREAKLRPTRQRVDLARLLFSKGDRHVCAETLFDEARDAGVNVSLATIYNTLHQFTDSGLLRAITVDSSRTYFDTNTGDHHHFYLEDSNELIDMPHGYVKVDNLPQPPEGLEISSVDVVVRVRSAGN
jgi:Fur family iron response transcriptional regulator